MNILHLSDIHFGRNYSRTGIKEKFERKEKILDELIDCIKKLDSCLQPEHIVVTGILHGGERKTNTKRLSLGFNNCCVSQTCRAGISLFVPVITTPIGITQAITQNLRIIQSQK